MNNKGLMSRENAVLLIIDVQEKLFPLISDKENILQNIRKLIRFAGIISMPVILTEQYPKGLGPTIPEVKELLPEVQPIEKMEFSCFGSERFREVLKKLGVKTLVIAGIETHICIVQTSIEGVNNGYEVCVISDASSSRNPEDRRIAFERMRQSGIIVASTEMLIYELLKKAGTQEFRDALKIIRSP
ncbi:MAG: hydrolase [candidate division WOR-3 bacterium]